MGKVIATIKDFSLSSATGNQMSFMAFRAVNGLLIILLLMHHKITIGIMTATDEHAKGTLFELEWIATLRAGFIKLFQHLMFNLMQGTQIITGGICGTT